LVQVKDHLELIQDSNLVNHLQVFALTMIQD